MEYLIRLIQIHETFRKPEIEALAILANVDVEFVAYSEVYSLVHLAHLNSTSDLFKSPYCIVRLPSVAAARALISRSILSKGIYELWGSGTDYDSLHADIRSRTSTQWHLYSTSSFKFNLDHYQGHRSSTAQRQIIESFAYLGFHGPIKMHNAAQEFTVFEDYAWSQPEPHTLYMGRWITASDRDAINTYSLKTRGYISTTSMDSELALVTANLTLAAPGKLFYDPFVGTGSFPIACSHFGAVSTGSDIDGRSIRGRKGRNIVTSFCQYNLQSRYLDGFISDLTHSPLRCEPLFDGIICDPPYGVREGLKVLGSKDGSGKEPVFIDGEAAHLQDKYIPPKRPYGFEAMLVDLLEFAAGRLVVGGRLSLWMPTANDEEVELGVPVHGRLEVVS
ncbi:MAG: hypothetical protein Q9187_003295, partial [Circinaria calcarea]